jgi:hypothetical protein
VLDRTAFAWVAEAELRTDEAVALAKEIVEWFFATYENPDDAFYDGDPTSRLGYRDVEPHDARDEIADQFRDELATFDDTEREEIVDVAVDEIEEGGCREWAVKAAPANVPLLRAHDHQWGKGHVHRFEADIGKTACGKKLENCPGDRACGNEDDITCKACLRLIGRR